MKIDQEVFAFAKKMTTLTYSFTSKAVQNFVVAHHIPYQQFRDFGDRVFRGVFANLTRKYEKRALNFVI